METRNINVNPVQPEINSQQITPPPKKTFPVTLILGIAIGITLTVSAVSAVYYFSTKNRSDISKSETQDVTPTKELSETKTYGDFGTIKWLSNPQKIPAVDIFDLTLSKQRDELTTTDFSNFNFSKAEYFQVGTFSNGAKLINIYLDPTTDPGGTILVRLIQDNDTVHLLKDMTINRETADLKDYLKNNVVLSEMTMDGLVPPKTITINDKNVLHLKDSASGVARNSNELTNLKKVYDSNFGEIYSNTFSIYDNISVDQIAGKVLYLKNKDGNFIAYNYSFDEISDNQIPSIIWNSGNVSSDVYTQDLALSCGSNRIVSIPVILDNSKLIKDKVEVGKTKNGIAIYQIQNKSNQFLLALYDSYKSTRTYDTNTKIISLDEFVSKNNHFLWQDPSGDWQIYVNQEFAPLAECGKPVIYLYPQIETQVKVQVGAKITQSEPIYPEGGWLVTAKPNGELIYQNQTYPYLFWEGLGNGLYPDYRNRGTLVAQKDLVTTLYKQLSQLGLNQKESVDFMEFWQPKLPKTPYVRLTWLNTQDMDILAPLAVTPRPDTSIRIFLEFQGLDKPINLVPQTLSAPKRQGFTLIEWGGLLLKTRQ